MCHATFRRAAGQGMWVLLVDGAGWLGVDFECVGRDVACVEASLGRAEGLAVRVASSASQYAATLSLPPAFLMSTVNAGLSRLLPGLSPA